MSTNGGTRTGKALHELILNQRQPDDLVYAVIDAARDWELTRSSWVHFGLEGYSLLGWDTPHHMQSVVPHLVPLKFKTEYPYAGSEFLDLWADRLGRSNGILLLTRVSRHRIFEHLAEVLQARDERGNELFFRYYDPRVLRPYLSSCRPDEITKFLGPTRVILAETEEKGQLHVYHRTPDGLREDLVSLDAPRNGVVASGDGVSDPAAGDANSSD